MEEPAYSSPSTPYNYTESMILDKLEEVS